MGAHGGLTLQGGSDCQAPTGNWKNWTNLVLTGLPVFILWHSTVMPITH